MLKLWCEYGGWWLSLCLNCGVNMEAGGCPQQPATCLNCGADVCIVQLWPFSPHVLALSAGGRGEEEEKEG